ncbi:hypothetical protein Tco_0839462 [Tanacetum coccineum]|uniref:Uncharacterized protein n=1 Tax=Tanacetum coccineum TaxID=301880 RepID=A0ABQ5AQN9_9ASTR
MLNKDNYVPWSSCLLRYAKSKPNGKLIYNSIMHGPYVRRMIPEPVIMEYLVKISKKASILVLKQIHLKITILTSYTPYPSRKIGCICACTSQETTKIQSPICRIQENSLYVILSRGWGGYTGEEYIGDRVSLLAELGGGYLRFGKAMLDLDTVGALQFQLGGAESARQIPDKGDPSAFWRGISSEGDFLSFAPSYTAIRDLMLRLCHRLIACSIAQRSQAPEKELDDTWAWVAPELERQHDAVVGALEVTEGAFDVDEGA